MPVTNVTHDADTFTLTIHAEFAAPAERVWDLYADPRQLEKVFGPPSHPATFVEHQLTPDTRSKYFMTGPEGERYFGVWDIKEVNRHQSFAFDDAFADKEFNPNPDMPASKNTYAFEAANGSTKAVFTSTYASAEALQTVLDMGVVEGASAAINQIDDFLVAA